MNNELKFDDVPEGLKTEITEAYGEVTYDLISTITIDTVSRRAKYVNRYTEEMEIPVLNSLNKSDTIRCVPEEGFIIRIDQNLNIVRRVLSTGPQAPLGI